MALHPKDFLLEIAATEGRHRMKRGLMWCSLGLVLLASAASAQAGGTEQAVAALEQKWLQSQQTNNPDLIAPLLADKLVDTSSDGKVVDKAGALATAKAMKYTSAEYYDLKVTAFGNTAIATGGFKGKGTDASGKPFETNERWTDTWVKMPNGQWQCVATQATPTKM
jgi:ketosteroid isomerase-like protein